MHIDRCMVNLLFIREDPLGRAQGGGTRATETARNPSPSGSRRGPSAPGEILSPAPSSLPPSPLPNPQVGPSIPHLPPCRPVVLISSIPPCPPPLKWVLCSVLPVVFRCHYSCVPVVFQAPLVCIFQKLHSQNTWSDKRIRFVSALSALPSSSMTFAQNKTNDTRD